MISNSNKKIIEVFILILVSFSPLLSNIMKVMLILIFSILNLRKIKHVNKYKFILFIFILFMFVVGLANDTKNINELSQINMLNLYFPLCFFIGFLISEKYSMKEYLYYLEKIIFLISIISLLGVCIYVFLPNLVYKFPEYNYYNTTHRTAYIFNFLIDDGGYVIKRNCGIAWEPGVFQLLLNLALYYHVKFEKKINFFKVFIYTIAIFSTKSTVGIICLAIIMLEILKNNKIGRILIILFCIIFLNKIIGELVYQFKYKLFGSYAFESRLEPMINVYKIGKDYLFGLGNNGYELNYLSMRIGTWDSFGQIFIRYGYVLLCTILLCVLKLLKNYKNLFFILFISFLSQGIWFFPLITPFYFMKTNIIKKVDS